MVGSKVRYKCEAGYRRILGESNFIVCINDTGLIHWTTKASVCERDSRATSQQSERKPENPVTIVPSDTAGYCGIPSPVEHTTPRVTEYAVGQELHYKCLHGYDARPPTSDISTCKEERGKTFWTRLSLLCTNDSKSGEEMTQPIPITDTLEPSHVSSVTFPVTGIPGSAHSWVVFLPPLGQSLSPFKFMTLLKIPGTIRTKEQFAPHNNHLLLCDGCKPQRRTYIVQGGKWGYKHLSHLGWKLRHLREFDAQVILKINLLRTDSELGL
ncbi:interleukin-2 receptor subunit alpha isoform X3 [Gopherus flavomarginatus]|nr:interleukin-2 receptor subunit alpha isoform X3 [Gopherus flavomarginatus]